MCSKHCECSDANVERLVCNCKCFEETNVDEEKKSNDLERNCYAGTNLNVNNETDICDLARQSSQVSNMFFWGSKNKDGKVIKLIFFILIEGC